MKSLPKKVVMATGNAGKVREISRLLKDLDIAVVPQSDLGVEDAEETGTSFTENSLIKARHAAVVTCLPAIADDSGLAVDALNGAPGVYSARYAGAEASDSKNIDKLLDALKDTDEPKRTAAFHCAACFVLPDDDQTLVTEGQWHGSILRERQGDGGFGYDPVFLDPESGKSAATLTPEQKNARSHRGQALASLVFLIKQRFS